MLDTTHRQPSAREPLLSAVHITKRFGAFIANDAIDLDIYGTEIHALLGENGAGKSTLVKIIYGLLQPTGGELRFAGRKVELAGPAAARALGIGMVFQHFSLFENLTVAENVALGLTTGEPFATMSKRLAALAHDYGLPLEPAREVWRLSVGERQRIEIVRALMQNPKLLILDEPTSVLTPQETDQLFITLKRLKGEGRAILYISHKLDEVQALCDTATILRGGRKIATCDPRLETAASLARMMVGADIGEVRASGARKTGVPRLVIRDLTLDPDDPHGVRLDAISLDVRGGEIVGIAGVSGNGQDELFAAISGERPSPDADNIIIDGLPVGQLSITDRRRLGAAFVPEERLGHGTAPRMKLSDNALLTGHASGSMVRHGFIDHTATLTVVDNTAKAFDVRKAKRDPEAVSLSGGNLQKFVVGREILREPGVLVVAQPTWGVDAGAAATIRQALIDLAARGAAVLIISQDLDEIEEIADRIAVIFHGRLSETVDSAATTRESLGLLMGGSTGKGKAGGTAYAGAPRSPTGVSHAASTRLVDIPPTSLPSPDLIRGLTRQSILVRRRWTRGSSPRVTGGSTSARHALVLERRAERSTVIAIASPLIAIGLTLTTMAVLFAALGKNPVAALMIYFIAPLTDSYSLIELAVKATPLAMIAVGLSLCYLANAWNIGAEGQFLIGAVCGSWLAVKTQGADAGVWVLPAMLVLGAAGGALYALIPAIAKVRFGANEILTSLMLVYVADLLLDYLVRGPWRDPKGFNFPTTAEFDPVATVPLLIEETRLHLGALIALAVVAVASVLLGRTIKGFEIRVVGAAPRAARFAGFDANKLVILTFVISGALAGLSGIIEVAGPVGHLQPAFSPGYGFTAIIVAFLGRLNPVGILIAGLFLALTFIGGEQAQISIKVPLDLTKVFQGILLFYVLACDSLIFHRIRIVSSRPGAADGVA